jgi:hypothetical protein
MANIVRIVDVNTGAAFSPTVGPKLFRHTIIANKKRIYYAGQWTKAENVSWLQVACAGMTTKEGAVIYAGGTQWHDKGDRAACLGISGRLLQNANSGV